jgi:hypothetical protein
MIDCTILIAMFSSINVTACKRCSTFKERFWILSFMIECVCEVMNDQMKISKNDWVLILAYYTNEIKKNASEHLSCHPPYLRTIHDVTRGCERKTPWGIEPNMTIYTQSCYFRGPFLALRFGPTCSYCSISLGSRKLYSPQQGVVVTTSLAKTPTWIRNEGEGIVKRYTQIQKKFQWLSTLLFQAGKYRYWFVLYQTDIRVIAVEWWSSKTSSFDFFFHESCISHVTMLRR